MCMHVCVRVRTYVGSARTAAMLMRYSIGGSPRRPEGGDGGRRGGDGGHGAACGRAARRAARPSRPGGATERRGARRTGARRRTTARRGGAARADGRRGARSPGGDGLARAAAVKRSTARKRTTARRGGWAAGSARGGGGRDGKIRQHLPCVESSRPSSSSSASIRCARREWGGTVAVEGIYTGEIFSRRRSWLRPRLKTPLFSRGWYHGPRPKAFLGQLEKNARARNGYFNFN